MIIMGNYLCIPQGEIDVDPENIVNLSSPIMGYNRLDIMPPLELKFTFDNQFDQEYYNYLIMNDGVFFELMNKVIIKEYMNENVYIIVSEGEGYDYINESLMKMINARYGFVIRYINDRSDYLYLNDNTELSFNIYGVANLDEDLERFRMIVSQINPDLFNTIIE